MDDKIRGFDWRDLELEADKREELRKDLAAGWCNPALRPEEFSKEDEAACFDILDKEDESDDWMMLV